VDELVGLVKDLPSPTVATPAAGRLDRWTHWWAARTARLQQAWRRPRLESLVLPRGDRVFVIGRAPECDLALLNMTVSWRHAELRRAEDGWVLSDLGSRNGTHVNGWQAGAGFTVLPGDHVRFGTAEFRICE
jgi:Inner membrane component of T3SS, cytoplasmic domain